MEIKVTVHIDKFFYEIYDNAARLLGNYTTAEVMSAALVAYAQYLESDMRAKGELKDS